MIPNDSFMYYFVHLGHSALYITWQYRYIVADNYGVLCMNNAVFACQSAMRKDALYKYIFFLSFFIYYCPDYFNSLSAKLFKVDSSMFKFGCFYFTCYNSFCIIRITTRQTMLISGETVRYELTHLNQYCLQKAQYCL